MGKYYVHNGQVYKSDELQHWKYIKRYKLNGKWQYVYADKDTHKSIHKNQHRSEMSKDSASFFKERAAETNVVEEGGVTAYQMRKDAQRFNEQESKKYEQNANKLIDDNSVSTLAKNVANNVKKETTKAANTISSTAKKTVKTVSDFTSSSVSKGKSAVSNLLKKFAKIR